MLMLRMLSVLPILFNKR